MGQTWSKHWTAFGVNFSAASISYFYTFYIVFKTLMQRKSKMSSSSELKEVTALSYATNTISTINAFITTFCGFLNLILNHSSLFKHIIINDQRDTFPKIPFFTYAYFLSYLIVDFISHLIIVNKYGVSKIGKNKVIQILIHHLLASSQFILIQIPKPVYLWPLFNLVLIMETSTIPLNLKWFAKYYKWSKKTVKLIDYAFLFTWFGVRIVSLLSMVILVGIYWDEAIEKLPKRVFIIGIIILILGFLPQIMWTGVIIKNIYAIKTKARLPKRIVFHGQQISQTLH
eukprot:547154_1